MNLHTLWTRWPRNASAWFIRLRETPATQSASDAFMRWLSSHPENERSYEEREWVWELSAELRGRESIEALIKEAEGRMAARSGAARGMPRLQGWRLQHRAVMAAAAAVVLVAGIISLWMWNRPWVAEYGTARGEQRSVSLPDGTALTLNTETHVRVRFTRSLRSIDLDAGEALFAVAKNARRPFAVNVLKGVSTAVGTQFDVRLREERAEVTVLEGSVRINTATTPNAEDGVTLTAGQALDYSASGDSSAVRSGNTQRIDAWKAHRILFDNTPLVEAIAEYNRYAAVPIVLKSPSLEDRRIHGVFRVGDEQSFVHALEQGLPLKAATTDGVITLIQR